MRKALSLVVPMLVVGISSTATGAAPSVARTDTQDGVCPPPFLRVPTVPIPFGRDVDRNENGHVCVLVTPGGVVTIDDREV